MVWRADLRASALSVVILGAACFAPASADRFSAYPLYSAVMETLAVQADSSTKFYVEVVTADLPAEARSGHDLRHHARELGVPMGVLRDFNLVNATRAELVDSVQVSVPVTMFPSSRWYQEGEGSFEWEGHLPEAVGVPLFVVTFSRPGFSSDGNTAFLYYSYYCGSLCGSGFAVVLRRRGNRWEIDRESQVWVS